MTRSSGTPVLVRVTHYMAAAVVATLLGFGAADAAVAGPSAGGDVTAPSPQPQGRGSSIVEDFNNWAFCADARLDTMFPAAPNFVFDCMRGAPGSNS